LAPDVTSEIRASTFRSLARNTPFDGWRLRGAVVATLVGGRTVYTNDEVEGAAVFGRLAGNDGPEPRPPRGR
jgi:dihydroorotase